MDEFDRVLLSQWVDLIIRLFDRGTIEVSEALQLSREARAAVAVDRPTLR